MCEIPEETRRRFDKWYVQQVLQHRQLSPTGNNRVDGSLNATSDLTASGSASSAAQRTRMRTSFDPELELPKLHRWFSENQHPTRLQIQQYVRELNSLESRKGRKPLDVNNVVYWFKNARAAYKRAEQRQGSGSHSPCHDSASNDNGCRDATDDTTTTTTTADNENHHHSGFSELRLTSSNVDVNGKSGKNTKKPSNGQLRSNVTEAIDLSTTHRDTEQFSVTNGHWKSCLGNKDEDDKQEEDDEDEEEEEDEEDVVIKQEPADGSRSSDNTEDDEDDDEYEGSTMEGLRSSSRPPSGDNSSVEHHATSQQSASLSFSSSPSHSNLHGQRGPTSSSTLSPQSHSSSRTHHHHHHPHHHPHSLLYMAGFMPNAISAVLDERRKRNRTFIDPVTEVPRLEQWFAFNTHPPHSLILKYTDELNQMPYRQKFPKLEPKNVQFWFKNRRAKCKRLRLSVNLVTSPTSGTTAATSW